MSSTDLILGIDGGGTKTVAYLANGAQELLGRGSAGPSNLRTCGETITLQNLDRAIDAAFDAAKIAPIPATSACVGLAGVDRAEDRAVIEQWAERRHLAVITQVVHDGLPVLFAGAPGGEGIALVAGTGSFAFGRTAKGETARCGGWGPLFGDEGSGYAIAVAGLRAAASAADGRGPSSLLQDRFLQLFDVARPSQLITAVYDEAVTRTEIAAWAVAVFEAERDADAVAGAILKQAANDLASLVATLTRRLEFMAAPIPLAVAGGILVEQPAFRERMLVQLDQLATSTYSCIVVRDPVTGALALARQASQ